jgi:hypothetical protein
MKGDLNLGMLTSHTSCWDAGSGSKSLMVVPKKLHMRKGEWEVDEW